MRKGYCCDNLDLLVRLSKENKDGLKWMVLLLLLLSSSSSSTSSSSSSSSSWSLSLMYGGERSGSGCDPFTSRQMWSQFCLPVKQVPERLCQDACHFADPAWMWWRCCCRHGTAADGLVVFRCTHWAFPCCVVVKLIEVKQVDRKWSWGRNFCRPFSITFAVISRTPLCFVFTYPLYICVGSFATSARRCDTWNLGYCNARCWSCIADNMAYLCVIAEVRLH